MRPLLLAAVFVSVGCAQSTLGSDGSVPVQPDGSGAVDSGGGGTCGGSVCTAGNQCCVVDCVGARRCQTQDLPCPLLGCPPPQQCGAVTCGRSEQCCMSDCSGGQACFSGQCPQFDCPPPIDAGPPAPTCGTTTCGAGEVCCAGCAGSVFCSTLNGGTCPIPRCPPPPDGGTVVPYYAYRCFGEMGPGAPVQTFSRECTSDADCAAAEVTDDCCWTQSAVGVSRAGATQLSALDEACKASSPRCRCVAQPTRLDDGNTLVNGGRAAVRCAQGRCQTYLAR